MTTEGEFVVRLDCDKGEVMRAVARPERPRVARKLLPGRSPEQAVTLVTTLFAICGRAQGVAAAAATGAAQSRETSPAMLAAREQRIVAETVHEHFWRVLVDWPKLALREPDTLSMGAIRKALVPCLEASVSHPAEPAVAVAGIARDCVFGMQPDEWLAIATLDELAAWWRAGKTPVARALGDLMLAGPALGRSDVALLDPLANGSLAAVLEPALQDDNDFEAAPHWQGQPRETGALSRLQSQPLVAAAICAWGHGVGARAVARLVELAQLVEVVAGRAETPPRHGMRRVAERAGLAWVETARGLLVHRAEIRGDRITDYRIVAPTEWNFHPQGAFVRGAIGLSAATPEGLQQAASGIVASLDPCVAWRVEVGHA